MTDTAAITVSERSVAVGNVELGIAEAGAGGLPLLLLHGYTGAKEDFEDFMVPLAERGWHVVAPDNRGHGASSKPADEADYSLQIFATDTLGLLDALGWDQAVILGHSMGGMFLQELVLLAPERVAALVLMDTGHRAVPIDGELRDAGVHIARTHGMAGLAELLEANEGALFENEAAARLRQERPEINDRHYAAMREISPAMYAAMALELTERPDRLAALAAIAVPTLVVVGELDEMSVPQSEAMAATIPGALLVVIADGGHCPQQEAPEAWWSAVSAFLDEVAATVLATPA